MSGKALGPHLLRISARVLTAASAVLRGRLGALTILVIVGLASMCLWAGYPVDLTSQSRRPPSGSRQDLAASESTSVGRRGLPARVSASSSLTAASRCPP